MSTLGNKISSGSKILGNKSENLKFDYSYKLHGRE